MEAGRTRVQNQGRFASHQHIFVFFFFSVYYIFPCECSL